MRQSLFYGALILIGALVSFGFLSWFIPTVNGSIYSKHERWCDERWGQSKLRHKFVNGICFVEIEDGFIPDHYYKSGRIK